MDFALKSPKNCLQFRESIFWDFSYVWSIRWMSCWGKKCPIAHKILIDLQIVIFGLNFEFELNLVLWVTRKYLKWFVRSISSLDTRLWYTPFDIWVSNNLSKSRSMTRIRWFIQNFITNFIKCDCADLSSSHLNSIRQFLQLFEFFFASIFDITAKPLRGPLISLMIHWRCWASRPRSWKKF